ncbi:MAG TPA: phosphatidylglycerol lysyltransferase domain-containing protein [Bacillota bacterium]|nr:phosphatidylglycerol lysyltransferase domain-containing protein [Bacillota bacterium]
MLHFKKLELSDIPLVRPYFNPNPQRITDLTVGGTFIWRDLFQYEYTVAADCLIFSMTIFEQHRAYSVPLGLRREEALSMLEQHCRDIGEPLVFCIVGDMDMPLLSSRYRGFHAIAERDYFDYLYEAQDLLKLEGSQHKATRNNIKRFLRTVPNWRYERIGQDNLDAVRAFAEEQEQELDPDNKTLVEEAVKIREVLDHMELYRAFGGVLFVGDQPAGFSLAETEGDTIYIHIEKADTRYRGVYQMLVSEFMKTFGDRPDIAYINREDDTGDPGLRQSKKSYGPIALLSKYTVYTCSSRPEWMKRSYTD